jgi:hypothetical protein
MPVSILTGPLEADAAEYAQHSRRELYRLQLQRIGALSRRDRLRHLHNMQWKPGADIHYFTRWLC